MEFEAVCRISVGDLRLQVGRKIDNIDGVERAFLRADTASYAQRLGYEGNPRGRFYFDTQLTSPNDWTRFAAFCIVSVIQMQMWYICIKLTLSAFLRLAFVCIDDGNSAGWMSVKVQAKRNNLHIPSKLVSGHGEVCGVV